MIPFEEDDEDALLGAGSLQERTVALLATVHELTGTACRTCQNALCGHEAVLAVVLGSRLAPRCATCAAREQQEPLAALCERSLQWILRRDCFLIAWLRAGEQEGFGRAERPACLFDAQVAPAAPAPTATPVDMASAPPTADAHYDAGDLGCGDLVMELRFQLADLPAGTVLQVTAHDPAAPVDLPAWCGLCGHTLRHASHPHYWIQRKGERR